MSAVDALYLLAGCLLSLLILLGGILGRLVVPGWAYDSKSRECEGWQKRCDDSTRLASQATTIAEHLARNLTAHVSNHNAAP